MVFEISPELRATYEAAGQGQVFRFVDAGLVNDDEKKNLEEKLMSIDVNLVNELYTETMAATSSTAPVAALLQPCKQVTSLKDRSEAEVALWRDVGLKAICTGELAILILAGGQGTRLGSSRPKGEFDINLLSHKTIFRLLADRIIRVRQLAKEAYPEEELRPLGIYVMTSPMTDTDTREFWRSYNYFNLPEEDIFFFCQGTLPCLDRNGKILMESGSTVAEAPDGNGGVYRALHISGALEDMTRRNVRGIHAFAIDNAIVRVADPVFAGFCLSRDADVGSKSCPKAGPHEKVGVLCLRDGVYSVVEYSEMDAATAELRDSSGELVFNTSNICIHYYSLDFLKNTLSLTNLPKVYHPAYKAIPIADEATGMKLSKQAIAPLGNTGLKLESFIFDVFPKSQRMAVLEIKREEEFSPVKNANGAKDDTPDSARDMMSKLHRQWLVNAGAKLIGDSSSLVEVSGLVSYSGEGLQVLNGLELPTPILIVSKSELGESSMQAVLDGVGHDIVGTSFPLYRTANFSVLVL